MENSRQFWIDVMLRISNPVFDSLSKGRLRGDMPLKHHPDSHDRADYTYLEALGRTLMGVAPWLETPAEYPVEGRNCARITRNSRARRLQWRSIPTRPTA